MALVAAFTREQWEDAGGWHTIASYVDAVVLEFGDDPADDASAAAAEPPYQHIRIYKRNDDGNGWYLHDEWTDLVKQEQPDAA